MHDVTGQPITEITRDIASRVVAWRDCTVPGLRRLRREVSRELRQADPRKVVGVAVRLVQHPDVPRWFAYELVLHHPAVSASLTREDVEKLGSGMSTWGEVDAFGCYIAGPAFREGRLRSMDVRRWARSDDRWWRRAALVSTVPLNNSARGGHGDAARTLAICDHLRSDRDDMVVKAMSWALRELAKKDAEQVEAYLIKNDAELAPRVLREVRNKLRTGLKNPKPTTTLSRT